MSHLPLSDGASALVNSMDRLCSASQGGGVSPPNPSAWPHEDDMICEECGFQLKEGAPTCLRCGAQPGANRQGGRRATQTEDTAVAAGTAAGTSARSAGRRRTMLDSDDDAVGSEAGRTGGPGSFGSTGFAVRRETALDNDEAAPPRGTYSPSRRKATMLDDGEEEAAAPNPTAAGPRLATGERVVGWMVSFDVNDRGQEHTIREGRNRIGRSREAEISLWYDDLVSDTHATLVVRSGQTVLRDEMSVNGTFVNEGDIGAGQPRSLRNGDVLKFGKSVFKVFLLEPADMQKLWPHVKQRR